MRLYRWAPRYDKRRNLQPPPVCATVEACDGYVSSTTRNATLTLQGGRRVSLDCANTLLAHSGAELLNSAKVSVHEMADGAAAGNGNGLAKFRVLDAYALTRGRCDLTEIGDGRHYYSVDMRILELIVDATRSNLKRIAVESPVWSRRRFPGSSMFF